MEFGLNWLCKSFANYLTRDRHIHGIAITTPPESLMNALKVGDLLPGLHENKAGHCFVEVDMIEGVRSVGIDKFIGFHTRICRPDGLDAEDCRHVATYAIARIGQQYDLRNILDLARYLLPTLPVPSRFRRQMLTLGSGDPTRAICSTIIAQAFQSVRYPILPVVNIRNVNRADCPACVEEIYRQRHHSLFTPRDFDVSPYFKVIKPIRESGFDLKSLKWEELLEVLQD